MKRLWFAVGVLVLLFSATLVNAFYLQHLSIGWINLLRQAETQVSQEDGWEEAEKLTEEALEKWESHETYLYTVTRHSDGDQIQTSFREVQQYLSCRDPGEYFASNARLITQISLLYEMEQLNFKNLM